MGEKSPTIEFFDDVPRLLARYPRSDAGEPGWLPAVDVRETDDEVMVLAALPGVSKEDIVLEVSADCVTLSGRRGGAQQDGWVRREILPGPFARRVALPAAVRAERASAAHSNGILEIRLPKERQEKAHTLKVL